MISDSSFSRNGTTPPAPDTQVPPPPADLCDWLCALDDAELAARLIEYTQPDDHGAHYDRLFGTTITERLATMADACVADLLIGIVGHSGLEVLYEDPVLRRLDAMRRAVHKGRLLPALAATYKGFFPPSWTKS